MLARFIISKRIVSKVSRRAFADAATPAVVKPAAPIVAAPVVKSGGGFMQRFSSFCVGIACGAGFFSYFIDEELKRSNKEFSTTLECLNDRIRALEGK